MRQILSKLDVSSDGAYPCDKAPGYWVQKGVEHYITAKNQIKIYMPDGRKQIFSPSIYQSSMKPDKKEIRTLQIEVREGKLLVRTKYEEKVFECHRINVEVLEWIPHVHKTNCKRCENCGRCGW